MNKGKYIKQNITKAISYCFWVNNKVKIKRY